MSSDRTYRVVVTREDDTWLADVPDVEGTHTEGRTLARLDRYVREAIGLAEDLPRSAEAGLRLLWEFRTGETAIDVLAPSVRRDRERLEAAEREQAEVTAQTVRKLRRHLSVRDTARLVGVSPQRVSQLEAERYDAAAAA